ncbi:MAG: hypothetical protein KJ615_07135, partial [Bacteroidetes bacterium]|nr:hypothetical protein [Bacteroidota bacterium]
LLRILHSNKKIQNNFEYYLGGLIIHNTGVNTLTNSYNPTHRPKFAKEFSPLARREEFRSVFPTKKNKSHNNRANMTNKIIVKLNSINGLQIRRTSG